MPRETILERFASQRAEIALEAAGCQENAKKRKRGITVIEGLVIMAAVTLIFMIVLSTGGN